MADTDVRDDPELQSMIQAELQRRRGELEEKRQEQESSTTSSNPQPTSRPQESEPVPTGTPERDRRNFNRLAETLCVALERGDQKETDDILGKMKVLQEKIPDVIPSAVIVEYGHRVETLRVNIQQLADEIVVLIKQAVSASRNGSEPDLARAMRRLTAIHAAHPRLLDEPQLEDVRSDISEASAERSQHQRTTKKLLDRERAITGEVKNLAAAVREFHRVACNVPETSDEFHEAEAKYLRVIEKARTFDAEWFSGVVLELADVLAEWNVPPLGAEGRIDRFLDRLDAGLGSIREEMREIKRGQDSSEVDGSGSAAP